MSSFSFQNSGHLKSGVNLQTAEGRVHNPSLFMPLLMVSSCNQAIPQQPMQRYSQDFENFKWHQLVECKKIDEINQYHYILIRNIKHGQK